MHPTMVPPEMDESDLTADELPPEVSSSSPVAAERSRRFFEYASVAILFFINLINYMDRYTVAGEHMAVFNMLCFWLPACTSEETKKTGKETN